MTARPNYLLTLCLLFAAGTTQAQQVQPGLWEVEHEVQIPGKPQLNAQIAQMRAMLKDLPPEMRGMLEQQMAKMGLGIGAGTTLRVCLTPDDVKGELIREGRTEGGCTLTQVNRQGNTWQGQVVCTEPPGSGEFTAKMLTPTHYTTTAQVNSEQYGRLDVTADARHVSRDCGALGK